MNLHTHSFHFYHWSSSKILTRAVLLPYSVSDFFDLFRTPTLLTKVIVIPLYIHLHECTWQGSQKKWMSILICMIEVQLLNQISRKIKKTKKCFKTYGSYTGVFSYLRRCLTAQKSNRFKFFMHFCYFWAPNTHGVGCICREV